MLLLLLCAGCNLDSNDETPPDEVNESSTKLLLHKVYKNGLLLRERNYSADSLLINQSTFSDSGSLFLKQEFSYSADTIITISFNSTNDTTQIRYSYPFDNSSIRVDRYEVNELKNYAIYDFENNSCPATNNVFYNPDSTILNRYETQYTDSNCSSNTNFYNSLGELIASEHITRDAERTTAYKLVQLFRGENEGNIIEHTRYDENGEINLNTSYSNQNEYDPFGNLIETTTTYLNNEIEIITYEYL